MSKALPAGWAAINARKNARVARIYCRCNYARIVRTTIKRIYHLPTGLQSIFLQKMGANHHLRILKDLTSPFVQNSKFWQTLEARPKTKGKKEFRAHLPSKLELICWRQLQLNYDLANHHSELKNHSVRLISSDLSSFRLKPRWLSGKFWQIFKIHPKMKGTASQSSLYRNFGNAKQAPTTLLA